MNEAGEYIIRNITLFGGNIKETNGDHRQVVKDVHLALSQTFER
jgi:hypothetical protein